MHVKEFVISTAFLNRVFGKKIDMEVSEYTEKIWKFYNKKSSSLKGSKNPQKLHIFETETTFGNASIYLNRGGDDLL